MDAYIENTINTAELLHAHHENRKSSTCTHVPGENIEEAGFSRGISCAHGGDILADVHRQLSLPCHTRYDLHDQSTQIQSFTDPGDASTNDKHDKVDRSRLQSCTETEDQSAYGHPFRPP